MGVTWTFGSASSQGDEACPWDERPPSDEGEETMDTKICPRCGAELFSDMGICYECLYDFARTEARPSLLPENLDSMDDLDEPELGERPELGESSEALASVGGASSLEGTTPLEIPRAEQHAPTALSLRLRCSDLDLVIPLSQRGLVVGRLSDCNVTLHSAAVSRRHVRFSVVRGEACVEDLGATNPAMLRGRAIEGSERLRPGDTVDVCGTLFTLVEP